MPDPIFSDLSVAEFVRAAVRLGIASVLGALLGLEREVHRRYAGLRTHILVTLGSATFVLLATAVAAQVHADLLRVVQGVASGIGFLGAGTILKLQETRRIEGLTTASSIWAAAAIGTAIGAGFAGIALASTVMALIVLWLLRVIERYVPRHEEDEHGRPGLGD